MRAVIIFAIIFAVIIGVLMTLFMISVGHFNKREEQKWWEDQERKDEDKTKV